jgi:hypothetical protein
MLPLRTQVAGCILRETCADGFERTDEGANEGCRYAARLDTRWVAWMEITMDPFCASEDGKEKIAREI